MGTKKNISTNIHKTNIAYKLKLLYKEHAFSIKKHHDNIYKM